MSTARQATKNGEAEGYSIPAQREACLRKARELSADVVDGFVDAASARSADRDSLQRMLGRVRDGDIAYVVVHKLDRLARSRIDDAESATVLHLAGTTLAAPAGSATPPPGVAGATTTTSSAFGRRTSRLDCGLPHLPVSDIEDAVQRQWNVVRFTDDQVEEFSHRARADLHRSAESGSRLHRPPAPTTG